MRISLGDLNYYRDSLSAIGEQAAAYVRESIEALGSGAGVTAMREAAIAAIQDSVGIHGEMAQALAGQLFDEVCMAEGLGVLDFELLDGIIDFGMLEEKVRYFAKYLVEHDGGDRFINDCSQLAEFYARRCNWESMVRNCERGHVKYARIPTGLETCDWCLMLASRGFDYYTQEAAEHANHEHCFVGDTRVSASSLLGAERRYYQGPLVHIVTANGNELTVTPNHPILTMRGWVAAGEVNDGDYLFCTRLDHGNGICVPDEDHVPPKIEDVFGSLCLLNPSGFHTMPTTTEDFHGDGMSDGEVNVVRADGLLEHVRNIARIKPSGHEGFPFTHLGLAEDCPSLSGSGVLDFGFDGDGGATDGIVSGLGLCGAFSGSHLGSPDESSSTMASGFDSSFFEPSHRGGAGDSVGLGNCVKTLAAFVTREEVGWHLESSGIWFSNFSDIDADSLEMLAKGIRVTSESFCDGGNRLPASIEISRVVHKSVSVRSCHVYNLTTQSSWYYANNIIAHNCDCVVVCGGDNTTVEGYDPMALYNEWNDWVDATAKERSERKGTTAKDERAAIMARYERASSRSKAKNRLRQT